MKTLQLTLLVLFSVCIATAQVSVDKQKVIKDIDDRQEQYFDVATQIWNYAEVGYQEEKSAGLLQQHLSEQGFSIEKGVADIPTAFVGSYGSGAPIIAILGEFDALPGVSQTASPFREKRSEVDAGHACGHHLFGAGSCLLYTSPSPRDLSTSRMPSSA